MNPWSKIRNFNNPKGFSLVSILTSMSLMGVLTLAIVKLSSQGNKITRSLASETEVMEFENRIKRLLSNPETCEKMIFNSSNNSYHQIGSDINAIYKRIIDVSNPDADPTFIEVYNTDYKNNSFAIESIQTKEISEENEVELVFVLEMRKGHLGSAEKMRKIPLSITRLAADNSRIETCKFVGIGYGSQINSGGNNGNADINEFITNIENITNIDNIEQYNTENGTDFTVEEVRCAAKGGVYNEDEGYCYDNDLIAHDCVWHAGTGNNQYAEADEWRYTRDFQFWFEASENKSRPILMEKNHNRTRAYRSVNGYGGTNLVSCLLKNRRGNQVKVQNCNNESLTLIQNTQERRGVAYSCPKKSQILTGFKWWSSPRKELGYDFKYSYNHVEAHPSQDSDQDVGVSGNCCQYVDQETQEKAKVKNCFWTPIKLAVGKSSAPHNTIEHFCPKDYHMTGMHIATMENSKYKRDRYYIKTSYDEAKNMMKFLMFAKNGHYETSIQCCQIHF